MTTTRAEPMRLSAMLGSYPKTAALKQGTIASDLVRLDFADVDTAQKAFKDVVRGLKFDVAELAIMTFLQAYDLGKPYCLLPFVMNGNFHHKSILCRADATFGPADLAGKRVAMRAYTQTTPAWVRGILSDEYGVKLSDVQWLSQEGPHVAEYVEPAWLQRLPAGAGLEELLIAGEVDAIVSGGAPSGDARVRPLIADPKEAALAWHQRTGLVPINHMVVIRREIAAQHPAVVREVMRLLEESRRIGGDVPAPGALDLQPSGFARVRGALELAIRLAHEQELISRRFSVEEIYGDVQDALQ